MLKKLNSVFLALLLLCSLLTGCAEQEVVQSGKPTVVATVFPAYDFVREIAGDSVELVLLVPPGTELHSFEPTPQDMLRIQNCDLLVCNGGESEVWLDEVLEGVDGKIHWVAMMQCVSLVEEEVTEDMQVALFAGEEEEEEYDEHVWTSPVNAIRICRCICEELTRVLPEQAEELTARCEAYCLKLSELDTEIQEIVQTGDYDTLLFADRFPMRYFVEEYGLNYSAAFPGCADDAEPSARTVAKLIDRVREGGYPAVFYIDMSDRRMANIICEETGCKAMLFHSCQNVTPEEFEAGKTYLELMQMNAEHLREALNHGDPEM